MMRMQREMEANLVASSATPFLWRYMKRLMRSALIMKLRCLMRLKTDFSMFRLSWMSRTRSKRISLSSTMVRSRYLLTSTAALRPWSSRSEMTLGRKLMS